MKRKRRWKRLFKLALLAVCALPVILYVTFAVLDNMYPFPEEEIIRFFAQKRGARVLDRSGRHLRTFAGKDDSLLIWANLDDISPTVRQATLAIEDSRFLQHNGVDFAAIMRAMTSNVRRGRRVSGASTITMQLCKQLNTRPRTFRTKLIETLRAFQIERIHSKREILELYLNSVPYGGNLIGVEAASLRYFNKHAKDLTLGEAALLAGLPQSPSRFRPDRHPKRALRRRNQVLEGMLHCGYIDQEEHDRAIREELELNTDSRTFLAPHFCEMVREQNPFAYQARSCIDATLQARSEQILQEYASNLRVKDIHNAAIVVIETETAAVRTLCGAIDYFDEAHSGRFNSALGLRSPGSAIKPFTYALAFHDGLATPGQILYDVPRSFAGYSPSNFDREFRGLVRADEALADSLNLPAIRLLNQIGAQRLYSTLSLAGIDFPSSADHYGLALTMGGAEVCLLDLTNAYASLARLGTHKAYRMLESEPESRGRRVLSRDACYMVAEALAGQNRLEQLWGKSTDDMIKMAWKTGTSNGYRDAWTIAFTPEYTVGVWLGTNGAGLRDLIGITTAAPLAARVMEAACAGRPSTWFSRPGTIRERKVCLLSGMPAGLNCTKTGMAFHSALRSSRETCTVHRRVEGVLREVYPADVAQFLIQQQVSDGLHRLTVAPRILTPADGQAFQLLRDLDHQQLRLRAAGQGTLYWFVNGQLHGSVQPGDDMWWAIKPGKHEITCSDPAGNSSTVNITVR